MFVSINLRSLLWLLVATTAVSFINPLKSRRVYKFDHFFPFIMQERGDDKIANIKSWTQKGTVSRIASVSTLLSTLAAVSIVDKALGQDYTKNAAKSQQKLVLTSKVDTRQYKAITLPNNMRVLLISDKTTTRGAAAIDVHVGSLSDPPELNGLAHFCEHMLFLGTKKYPVEDDFSNFISANGGSDNAYTDAEDTVYYFDVNAEKLGAALDRFAQFFICPLFTESATGREINAIESEHSKNINSDSFRLFQLDKMIANENHPYHMFATGNKETLKGENLRQKLLEFHDKYYSSHLMTLSVLGKESIEELESMTAKLFNDVKDKRQQGYLLNSPEDEWWGKVPPFRSFLSPFSARKPTLLEIVPVEQVRSISISWPIWVRDATERRDLLQYKPAQLLSHLLGHEGKGSLRSYLISKNYCSALQAYTSNDLSDLEEFEVNIDLTPEGFAHRDDVIDAVFAYISLLDEYINQDPNKVLLPSYIYDELRELSRISFDFRESAEPMDLVSAVVANMQSYYAPQEYLSGPTLYTAEAEDANQQRVLWKFFSHFNVGNSHIRVVGKEFLNKTTAVEQIYGTEFNQRPVEESTARRWTTTSFAKYGCFHLPAPNKFIPRDFTLRAQREISRQESSKSPPRKILSTEKFEVWHKLDESFSQPKAYSIFSFAVPRDLYSAHFLLASKLWIACFDDAINEKFFYDARLAKLKFTMEMTPAGFKLILSGFNDKLQQFTREIFEAFQTFTVEEKVFERMRDILRRELRSWQTEQPYEHASYYQELLLETLRYPIEEYLAAIEQLQVTDIADFFRKTLCKSFGTALIAGNVAESEARETVEILSAALDFQPLAVAARSRREIRQLPVLAGLPSGRTGYLLTQREPNSNDENSATSFYLQLPARDIAQESLLEVLAAVLEQPFYSSLRTRQQLGYIVFSGVQLHERVPALIFTVQSSIVSAAELTRRIEHFLRRDAVRVLENLTDDRLQSEFISAICARLLEPDQRLSGQSMRLWNEIISNSLRSRDADPAFNRREILAEAMQKITVQQLIDFAKEFIFPDGAQRRLLVTEIQSQIPPKERESDRYDDIDDVDDNDDDDVDVDVDGDIDDGDQDDVNSDVIDYTTIDGPSLLKINYQDNNWQFVQ